MMRRRPVDPARSSASAVRGVAILLGAAVLLAACASDGSIDNPVERRFSWFDYISGGDLRRACASGSPAAQGAYRFVEYRNRAEQVRIYELRPGAGGGEGARLRAHVLEGPIRFSRWPLFTDPLHPWQGEKAETRLGEAQVQAIASDAAEGGLLEPPPVGRTLASRSFFWLVAACREGTGFAFQVWEWPDAGYRGRDFAEILHGADPTGIPLNPLPAGEGRLENAVHPGVQEQRTGHSAYEHYDLIVGDAGVSVGRSYPPRSSHPID